MQEHIESEADLCLLGTWKETGRRACGPLPYLQGNKFGRGRERETPRNFLVSAHLNYRYRAGKPETFSILNGPNGLSFTM